MYFSIIVPVYNRPEEIKAFIESISKQIFDQEFELIIVEDGSQMICKDIVTEYSDVIDICYYYKKNSGPGDSRNYGMKKAKGEYFLIFDSDCELPEHYLQTVKKSLDDDFVDCFGGPDAALNSFSDIQKAINFAMTSFLTTGGIRGGSEKVDKFQPRSFNMGISKVAFVASNGFGNIHPGEDPDLSIRLWNLGFKTRLIKKAYVYHKRRLDWNRYFVQVNKFGIARPILDSWYSKHRKIIFAFPTIFSFGFLVSIVLSFFEFDYLFIFYCCYFLLIFILATFQNRNAKVGMFALFAVIVQFFGYGFGYFKSFFLIRVLKLNPKKTFPHLFFQKT